jgi:hypothetical protein
LLSKPARGIAAAKCDHLGRSAGKETIPAGSPKKTKGRQFSAFTAALGFGTSIAERVRSRRLRVQTTKQIAKAVTVIILLVATLTVLVVAY